MIVLVGGALSFIRLGEDTLARIKKLLLGLLVIGLGVLMGYLLSGPAEMVQITASVTVVLLLMIVVMAKPLHGLMLLIIFLPFIESYVKIPMGAGIPDLSFSRFTVAFLAIAMLAKGAIGKFRFVTPIDLAEVFIVLTSIGIMFSALLVDNPMQVIQQTITRFFVPLGMYFFAKNLVRDQVELHKLFGAIAAIGFLAAVYAIYENTTGHILFLGPDKSAEHITTQLTDNLRLIRGLLGRASNFGRLFGATIPVTLYLGFETRKIKWKTLLFGILIVQFYALFITYNRTSWYAALISLSLIQFFYPQFRRVYLVLMFVALVGLWATWEQVNNSTVVEERVNEKTEGLNGREERFNAAVNMWKARPVFGWGDGAFNEVSGQYRTDGIRRNLTAIENDYLDILVCCGLVGFVPYALFILVTLINSIYLFFKARAPTWQGFIKPETVTIYWCVTIAFLIGSYTQEQTEPLVRITAFAVAGAVVGSQMPWLRGSKSAEPVATSSFPATSSGSRYSTNPEV